MQPWIVSAKSVVLLTGFMEDSEISVHHGEGLVACRENGGVCGLNRPIIKDQ
jgi:hypothetical protein